jgi:hypothetical protein
VLLSRTNDADLASAKKPIGAQLPQTGIEPFFATDSLIDRRKNWLSSV